MWTVSEVEVEIKFMDNNHKFWSICHDDNKWNVYLRSNKARNKIASFKTFKHAKEDITNRLGYVKSCWAVCRIANGNLAIRKGRDGNSVFWSVLLDAHQIKVCKTLRDAKEYADKRLNPHRRSKR